MPDDKKNNDELILVNIMEEIVKLRVKTALKELGACTCETCYLNACALALNALKPKYVTTEKGALFVKITETELAHSVTILFEVTRAIMQVKEHPCH